MKFRGIPGKRPTGANADIEVEVLAEADDGAEVDVSLFPELRGQFLRRLLLGLGRDGAEEPEMVLPEEIQGSLGEGVPFLNPELPTDIGVDVIGVETDHIAGPEGTRAEPAFPIPSPGMVTTVRLAIVGFTPKASVVSDSANPDFLSNEVLAPSGNDEALGNRSQGREAEGLAPEETVPREKSTCSSSPGMRVGAPPSRPPEHLSRRVTSPGHSMQMKPLL